MAKMPRKWILACLTATALGVPCAQAAKPDLYASIDERDSATWDAAVKIWQWAEPGYQETRSSKLLADLLEDAGLRVERGVADLPTAFTAEFGSGSPVIAILGEFDALPGLAQEAEPKQQARPGNGYGHGCGHHLFGAASASAAIAVAEQIRAGELKGTVRFYGCPAEEGGSGKVFMVRAGLFDDCDAALHWHPSSKNAAGDRGSLARIAVKFRFHGISAHAAGAPDQGRSALDAVELTNYAANLLREHVPDTTRIHYVITSGGSAPNVVPNFAEVYYYIRHPSSTTVRPLYDRLEACAKGAATATGTRLEVAYEGGTMELMPNSALTKVCHANLKELADLRYEETELPFASRIQATLEKPKPLDSVQQVTLTSGSRGRGSTDVGDVSWNVPTVWFSTACWAPGTPGHSWQAVAGGTQPLARRATNLAARVLAANAWDLMSRPEVLKAASAELTRRLDARPYESLMRPGQGAPLDYRRGAVALAP